MKQLSVLQLLNYGLQNVGVQFHYNLAINCGRPEVWISFVTRQKWLDTEIWSRNSKTTYNLNSHHSWQKPPYNCYCWNFLEVTIILMWSGTQMCSETFVGACYMCGRLRVKGQPKHLSLKHLHFKHLSLQHWHFKRLLGMCIFHDNTNTYQRV